MNKRVQIGLGILIGCLIIGPWIWIGILLNQDSSYQTTDLSCPDVSISSCQGDYDACLTAAK